MRNLRRRKETVEWVHPSEINKLKYQIIMNQATIFVIEKYMNERIEGYTDFTNSLKLMSESDVVRKEEVHNALEKLRGTN